MPGCDGAGTAKRSYPMPRVRGGGQEELPRVPGQGWQPRAPGCDSAGAAERSYPPPEARGGGREEQPTRSCGCAGAGGPRGAIPCSRSGGVAVRRYPWFKVRSSSCALLEQP